MSGSEEAPDAARQDIFFELYESLPRQGPGNRACTEQALALCRDRPASARILDLGCGVGAQTMHLSELTAGTILAIDRHAPSVARLARTVMQRGLQHRVISLVADMARLPLRGGGFDLVWSEGAVYNVGIESAVALARSLLVPGGYLAFTDAVWRRADPPAEVRAAFADDPGMRTAEDAAAAIGRSGLHVVGHFTLPDEAWWDDFYTPMERRIAELRARHAGDPGALATLDELAREPDLRRRHSDSYAYEFFVARRTV